MPRLNIYVPADLAREIYGYRDEINLSEVCASALRAVISARQTLRSADGLFDESFPRGSSLEAEVARRFKLRRVVAGAGIGHSKNPYETVAHWTSGWLDRVLREDLQLGVAGGTQMWSVIRRLSPRDLRLAISAIGFGHVDRVAPHLHPNVLVTLLSLRYPRSTVGLIDAPEFRPAWSLDDGGGGFRRVIVGSCEPFAGDTASAELLGGETMEVLRDARAVGDFLGVFLTPDGGSVEPYPPTATVSHISSADLREHAKRADTVVALAAAGNAKVEIIRLALAAELCNVLITDETTARALLSSARLD